jgi:hypothetical protein
MMDAASMMIAESHIVVRIIGSARRDRTALHGG